MQLAWKMEATICHQLPAFDSAAKGLVRYVIKNEISECDMNVQVQTEKVAAAAAAAAIKLQLEMKKGA